MENMTMKYEILHALDQDPKIDASHIGIIVDKGIVTLTGRVRSLADSAHAVDITKKVAGVKAVAQEIDVIDITADDASDESILVNVTSYLERDTTVPENQIQVSVRDGRVVVTGHVAWLYQKNAIDQILRGVEGISDYTNQVRILELKSDEELERLIRDKLANDPTLNLQGLIVNAHNGAVTLGGVIKNQQVHNKIVEVASAVPDVDTVVDHLTVAEH